MKKVYTILLTINLVICLMFSMPITFCKINQQLIKYISNSEPEKVLPSINYGIIFRILILPSNPTILEDQAIQFKAYGYDKEGKEVISEVKWRADGDGTIDQNGLFKAQKPGKAIVYAEMQEKYVTTTVTIKSKGSSIGDTNIQWPMYGMSSDRCKYMDDIYGPQSKNISLIWKFEAKKSINNSIIIGNNILFAGSGEGNYNLLNPLSGEHISSIVSDKTYLDTAVVVGNTLIIGSYTSPYIFAFDYKEQKTKWIVTSGAVNSELLYSNGNIYCSTTTKKFLCISADKGKIMWGFDTKDEIWSSPAYSDKKFFVGSDKGNLFCIDEKTGKLLWKQKACGGIKEPPVVGKDKVFINSFNEKESKLQSFAITNGRLCWEYVIKKAIVSSPALSSNYVCFTSLDGKIYCLEANDGKFAWSYETGDQIYCAPAIYGQKVVFGSDDHILRCIDIKEGIVIWSFETKDAIRSAPIVFNGMVYVASTDKNVYCLADFNSTPVQLIVEPRSVSLNLYDTVSFKAYALNRYNQQIEVNDCEWLLDGPGTITKEGFYTATAYGEAVVTAKLDKLFFNSFVKVIDTNELSTSCSDWPMFGKEPTKSRKIDDLCLSGSFSKLTKKWSKELEQTSKNTSIIKGNKLFFGTLDGETYCLDKLIGEKIWKNKSPSAVTTTMLYFNENLYFGTTDGQMVCANANNGEIKWVFDTCGNGRKSQSILSSPIAYDDKIIFGSKIGYLFCLNTLTGEEIWHFITQEESPRVKDDDRNDINSTVSCYDGKVYFGAYDNNFYCLDVVTGKLEWKYYVGDKILTSPLLERDSLFFGTKDYHLYSLDLNGKLRWRYLIKKDTPGKLPQVWGVPAVSNGKIYFGSDDENFYCLDSFNGKLLWKTKLIGWIQSSPIIIKDSIFVGTHSNALYQLNRNSGKIVSKETYRDGVYSSPIFSEGMIYVSTIKSNIYCYKLE